MKKKITKVLAVLLSGLVIFSSIPLSGYAENSGVVAQLKGRGFKEVVNLGDAATEPSLTSAVFGKENGRDVIYSTATGGKFNVIDVKDNKLLFWAQLEGVTQVWSHTVAPDGTVYIVALGPGNEGQLWRYKPATKTVTKIGRVEANGEQVWSSTTDEAGNIYIGTYSASGAGKIIKYNPVQNKFTSLGAVDSACAYVRSMAYHNGYLYAGLGVAGKVYRINVATGAKENITKNVPSIIGKSINTVKFCYDMAVVANRYLFARFDDGDGTTNVNALLIYDLTEQRWLNFKLAGIGSGGTDVGAFGFNQVPVRNNKAYVIYNRQLQEIDIASLSTNNPITRSTGIGFGSSLRGGAFVNFGTQGAPEWALATIKRDGSIFYVKNIETATDEDKVTMPVVAVGSPLTLHNLHKGNDGNLYMTTYPGGPKGARFDPRTGTFITYAQGQAEGIVAGNGTDMYFGIYPGAVIQKMNTDTLQVETLFELKSVYEQDRPYIMQFTDNKLFIGTIPDYGKLGGTLTIYDTVTGNRKTYRNIIQNQSIVGIAYKNGKIYGSTTIHGGLNINPTAQKAVMFVWDVATEKVIKTIDLTTIFSVLNKPPMISGLTFDNNGLLWGAVDGILFAMNPETYQIVKSKNIYPNIKDRGMWRPVHILFGEDGLIYTDIGGKLTVVDPDTLNFVTLVGSGKEVDWIALAKDANGNENIYFIQNGTTNLNMIEVIDVGANEPPATTVVNVPVTNAGFEQPLSGGSIPGWSSLFAITGNVSFGVSSERAKTGSKSLKIVDKATNETVFVQSAQIPVVAGLKYTASTEMYLVDGSATFFIRFFDNTGKQVGTDQDGVNIIHVRSGHGAWQTVQAVVVAPAGAKYCRLFAGCSNYFTTSGAYYDDFKLSYEYQPIVNVPVTNAGFEQPLSGGSIPGWSSLFAITSNVSFGVSNARAKTGSKSLKIVDGSQNETVFVQSAQIPVIAGLKYTASTEMYLVDGSATFFIRFFDNTGKQVGTDQDGVNIIHVRSGHGAWQTVQAVVVAPAGAKYCRLFAGCSNYFTTSGAYYDDFKLSYEVPQP